MKSAYRFFQSVGSPALCFAVFAALLPVAHADEAETLRMTQIQLRQSEQERSALRAEVARMQEQLAAQAGALTAAQQNAQRAVSRSDSAPQTDTALTQKLNQSTRALRSNQEELERLRLQSAQHAQAVQNLQTLLERARKTVAQRDEFVEMCRVRNQAMYQVGHEVLQLSHDDEMASLAAREPVLQLKRVQLENLAQDFEAKLREQRIYEDTLTPSQEKALRENMEQKAAAAADKSAQ